LPRSCALIFNIRSSCRLVLTLLVALVGSAVSFLLISGSAQDRLNNQLAQVASHNQRALVNQERANLVFLREVAFAGSNKPAAAPAVADALARKMPRAGRALTLIFARRPAAGVRADRLIAFDSSRRSLVDWELTRDPRAQPARSSAMIAISARSGCAADSGGAARSAWR
jgi:hypothetical protein